MCFEASNPLIHKLASGTIISAKPSSHFTLRNGGTGPKSKELAAPSTSEALGVTRYDVRR